MTDLSRPYLGPASGTSTPGSSTPTQILAGLVGVNSAENTTMPLVDACNATNSWLQLKINGMFSNQTCANSDLAGSPPLCGVEMPNAGMMLPQNQIDLIAGWINQGALNN